VERDQERKRKIQRSRPENRVNRSVAGDGLEKYGGAGAELSTAPASLTCSRG